MKRILKITEVFSVVLALSVGTLQATLIEINITAEIIGIDDRDGLLEGKITAGDIMTGSYIYESSCIDSSPSSTGGAYWYYSSPYGISLTSGGFVFQTDPDNVEFLIGVDDGTYGHDTYLLRSYNNLPLSNGVEVDHISWQLDDYSGTALSSDALPTTPPVLGDWQDNYLRITFGYKGYSTMGVDVTSVELLPEPATILLLGLGGLALLRKRRA